MGADARIPAAAAKQGREPIPPEGLTVDDAAIPELADGRTKRPVDGSQRRGWRLALGARRVLLLVFLSADRGRSAVHDAAQEFILSLDDSSFVVYAATGSSAAG